ncbi:hypothetical protein CKA32_000063 [Geitlerinema sp. FC II]|nr:hypothetical protein CKA32_000063 [Geitlerinema sp. FC II]
MRSIAVRCCVGGSLGAIGRIFGARRSLSWGVSVYVASQIKYGK